MTGRRRGTASGAPRFHRAGRAWQALAYFVGAVVLFAVVANVGAWAVLWVRDRQPCQYLQDFCDKPSGMARFRLRMAPLPYAGTALHVDREGWRVLAQGDALFEGFSSRNYNVFLLGGSTMFGFGVADGETIPAHLQALVQGRVQGGRPVRIYNLGQPAYTSREEAYLLVDQLKQGRVPDVAVFYDGINEECMYLPGDDMYQNLTGTAGFQETDLGYFTVSRAVAALSSTPIVNVEYLPALQLAWRLQRKLVRAAGGGMPLTPEDEARQLHGHARLCAGVYLDNAALVQRLGRAYGFQPVFVLQPSGALLPDADTYAFVRFGPPPAWRRAYYRLLYGEILAAAAVRGLPVTDLSGAMNEPAARGEAVFLEWQHLTSEGNRHVAVALLATLRKQGAL